MIIRSICIWIAVLAVWGLLMDPVISRQEAHEQRIAELDKQIAETLTEIESEKNYKSELLKQREQLTEQIPVSYQDR